MVNDDRGQLILIGALLVAATILGSITLLNTVHESPDVKTQQDAQSLDETERTVTQVKTDLNRLFLHNVSVNETGQPLPYANDTFAGIVDEYNRQSMNLSSVTTAGVLNVTYLGGMEGGIAVQNRTGDEYRAFPDGDTIIEDAETIPRLSLIVNQTSNDGSPGFTINLTAPGPQEIGLEFVNSSTGSGKIVKSNISGSPSELEWTCSDLNFSALDSGRTLRIDFVNGTGAISTSETYCGDLPFGTSLNPPIEVEFNNPGSDKANGTFLISGAETSGPTPVSSDLSSSPEAYRFFRGAGHSGAPYVVNPKFRLEYQTPNVAYNSTFSLYNTTGR